MKKYFYWIILSICILFSVIWLFNSETNGQIQGKQGNPQIWQKVTEYRSLLEKSKNEGKNIQKAEELGRQSRLAIQSGKEKEGLELLDKAIAELQNNQSSSNIQNIQIANPEVSPAGNSVLMVKVSGNKSINKINPFLFGTYLGRMGHYPPGLKTGLVYIDLQRSGVFPRSGKRDADPADPNEYNFTVIDKNVNEAFDNGIDPLIKIWAVPILLTDSNQPLSPPHDFNQYESIIRHVVQHLTKGWSNGYHHPIRFIELWNEPDLRGGGIFWKGTKTEFFKTFESGAKAIKSVNPKIHVGGPGFAWPEYTRSNTWIGDFLEYCKKNNVPLDFLSWHQYDLIPGAFYDKARLIDNYLNRYNTLSPLNGKPMSFNTEWNMAVAVGMGPELMNFANQFSSNDASAHNISSIIKMMDAGVHASYRIPSPPTWSISAQQMLIQMMQTPNRLESNGGNPFGVAVLAGISDDKQLIQVLVSHFNTLHINRNSMKMPAQLASFVDTLRLRLTQENNGVSEQNYGNINLAIEGVPWLNVKSSVIECNILDRSHNFQKINTEKYPPGKSLVLNESLPNPSVYLFKIYPEL